MKKALSLVLALAMVLSMAVVGFAADVEGTHYTAKIGDVYADKAGHYYVDVDIDVDAEVADLKVTAKNAVGGPIVDWIRPTNALEHKYTIQVAENSDRDDGYSVADFEAAFITITTSSDASGNDILDQDTYKVTYTAPAVAQEYLVEQMEKAYKAHSTTVELDANKLVDKTLTVADWKYITNTCEDNWGFQSWYLGMNLEVTDGTTIYTIPMDGVIWYNNDVTFGLDTSVVDEDGYNAIRKLTGDTKNPLVFGFAGMACPDMEIDMVIPQQWINYYGHKDLTLFAWQEAIMAKILNGEDADKEITVEDAKVLTKTTLDVNTTVTQRIQFETDYLYEVLVLSANGVKDTDNNGGSKDDNKDANPNTGANDIVNVAVVFAVVSLAAAGAFVCKKSK